MVMALEESYASRADGGRRAIGARSIIGHCAVFISPPLCGDFSPSNLVHIKIYVQRSYAFIQVILHHEPLQVLSREPFGVDA